MRKMIASPPSSMGLQIPGTPSKSYDIVVSQNSIEEEKEMNIPDTGLSRATVLLLLSAHLLRLLYFHGVVLLEFEVQKDGELQQTETLQWDLLGQSISMIVMQLLLLHAMMLIHRKHNNHTTQQRKRTSDGGITLGHQSTDSLLLMTSSANMTEAPMSGPLINGASPTARNNQRQNTKFRLLSHAVASHLRQLYSPHKILHEHTFLQYIELLFFSSMAIKLVFDYHWYPLYGIRVVNGLKHTSIVLESCLALPQTIRNYRQGSTEGLSVIMVGGWLAGDLFKLFYFMFNNMKKEGGGQGTFILGCLLSITLDSIVGIQMFRNKPAARELLQNITKTIRHWKANKDDDAGESLLMNNTQKEDGMMATWLRKIFGWARERSRQSCSS